jgi:uncharacterized protein YndB with AHSA1/START domain
MKGTLTHTLRFERRLPHAPSKVWRVLTDNAELAYWFPARIDGAREPGAKLKFVFFDKTPEVMDDGLRALVHASQKDADTWPPGTMDGEMRIVDPPRLLEYTWGGEVLRFELTPRGAETDLVFTHTFADGSQADKFAAGWHICFDSLTGRMSGAQRPATRAELDEHEATYAKDFGIKR